MQISLKIILPIVIGTGLVIFFLVTLAVRAKRQRSPVGIDGLVGQIGVVEEGNKVYVSGELWDSVPGSVLQAGDKVRIEAVEGMKVRVTKI